MPALAHPLELLQDRRLSRRTPGRKPEPALAVVSDAPIALKVTLAHAPVERCATGEAFTAMEAVEAPASDFNRATSPPPG